MPSKVDPVPVAFQDYFWLVEWWWRVVDVWLKTEVLGPVRRVRESPGALKAIDGPLIRRDSVWSAEGVLATGGVEIRETKDFPESTTSTEENQEIFKWKVYMRTIFGI
jgi:hypothetical protein